jgi:hypothetical protein
MSPDEVGGTSDQRSVEPASNVSPVPASGEGLAVPGGMDLFHPRLLAVLAGLVSGLVGFGLGEAFYGFFVPEAVPQMLSGAQVMLPSFGTHAIADARNGAVAFALLGGSLGLFLGLAGGLARRSIGRPRD